jgi:hypothetical protein
MAIFLSVSKITRKGAGEEETGKKSLSNPTFSGVGSLLPLLAFYRLTQTLYL